MMRLALAILAALLFASVGLPASAPVHGSMEELVAVDRLPFLYPPGTRTHQFASFSREESNNDGFSGQYSYLRYVMDGGEEASLIADFDQPGCIYRFWATAVPEGRIKFYLDGQKTPEIDIPFREMFESKHYPFLAPVAGRGLGGFYSYVPIAWKKSCRIVATSRQMRFYQITYLTFPSDKNVKTFRMKAWEKQRARFQEIVKLWSTLGPRPTAPTATEKTVEASGSLAAEGSIALAQPAGPGTVRALLIKMEPRTPDVLRAVRLRILYNGGDQAAVDCPLGDFFGSGGEDHAWASLLMGQKDGEYYCYFPMPFQKGARIELVYDKYLANRAQPEVKIASRVIWEPMKKWTAEQGYFHAQWHRQNPTEDRVNYVFLRAHGRGHLVGTIQYCDTPLDLSVPLFFEGDEMTYADGRLALHGTGSEDFYNMGWYALPQGFSRPGDFPLHGGLKYSPRSVAAYRFQMTDPVVFEHSLDHTIQHGGVNEIAADYASVAYWYQELPADPVYVPPVRERLIPALRPGGSVEAENALVRKDVVEMISEYDEPTDLHFSYGQAARIALEPGRPVTLEVEAPHAGGYVLYAAMVLTPDSPERGQARVGGTVLGDSERLRADQRTYAERVQLGQGRLSAGKQRIELFCQPGRELILDRIWLGPIDWRKETSSLPKPELRDGRTVYRYDFAAPASLSNFAVGAGDWQAVDGVVMPRTANGGVLWFPVRWKGDVRVEYRARGSDDLAVVLCGDGESVGRGIGYSFSCSLGRGRESTIGMGRRRPLARVETPTGDSRSFHDFVAEKRGGLLTFSMDGKEILRHELAPDATREEGYVGLWTGNGRTVYDAVAISGTPAR